ncbi:MAG: aminotransferase class I/II-fold pyridoxal phosphate-dependent enzyme, partial [Clostridiales bacterium]|nr:aminotransferase class I/II-fold pyridoxal phosphate-dependent enzyme [Clostridiales bacterium]
FNTPIYDPFCMVTQQQGCEVVGSGLLNNNGHYEMDWADMEAKMAAGVDLFILCNPHNPTGRVWSKEELEKLGNLCLQYKVPIFSDDIHSDLIFEGSTYTPILGISEAIRQNTVMAMAPSKTFNVAGLKSSYLVIPNEELRKKVATALANFHVGVNLFGIKATEVAYEVGEPWLEALNVYLKKNAEFVVAFCKEKLPKVKTYVPEGTYLLWLDFSAYGLDQGELMRRFIEDAQVALNDGSNYGEEGVGFVRMNIGTSKALLEEGLEAIARVFA